MSFQASSSEDLDAGPEWFGDGKDARRLEAFVQSIPKIELHVHLDGCFDPEELWEHLQKNPRLLHCFPVDRHLPWDSKPDAGPVRLREMVSTCTSSLDYRRLCTCRRRYRKLRHAEERKLSIKQVGGSLEDMLLCFEFFFPLVYDNFELLEHLAYDFVRRQREQNVIYTEVRYSPHLLASDPLKSYQAVTDGLRRGLKECPPGAVTINQILCGINFHPEWATDVVRMAQEFRSDFPCAVVGVDIAAGEDHFASQSPFHQAHLEMCRSAIDFGINITLHAGETPDSAHNVATAIRKYGAKRIGHGYRIATQDDIMELAISRNIHFEVCPTSSVETGGWIKTEWKDHPACVFRNKGVKVSLSSDDPAVFNTSLTWQFRIVLKKMEWRESDVLQSLMDAVDASFAPESEKERLRQQLQSPHLRPNPIFRDRVHYD
jgi:adenosine deaminase